MKAKHSKGPWEVHQGNDYLCVLRPDDTTDSAIHIPDGDIEDARLIAAAPELLAALAELLALGDRHFWSDTNKWPAVAQARAAIAKATAA